MVEQQSPHEQVNTLGLHVPDGKGLTLVSNSQKSIQILQMATDWHSSCSKPCLPNPGFLFDITTYAQLYHLPTREQQRGDQQPLTSQTRGGKAKAALHQRPPCGGCRGVRCHLPGKGTRTCPKQMADAEQEDLESHSSQLFSGGERLREDRALDTVPGPRGRCEREGAAPRWRQAVGVLLFPG